MVEPLIFDNKIVSRHPIYRKFHKMLNDISERDYPGKDYFDKRIDALDLDTYESSIPDSNDHTVDAVIGIKTYQNNRPTNPRLLLVELRMDYKSTKNLSETDLNSKVVHSRSLLGMDIPVERLVYFVFNDGIISQVERWFTRKAMAGGSSKNWKAISPENFRNVVRSESDMPYVPINDTEVVAIEIRNFITKRAWEKAYLIIKEWVMRAEKYQVKYNIPEFESICGMLKHELPILCRHLAEMDEETRMEIEILKEDHPIIFDQ